MDIKPLVGVTPADGISERDSLKKACVDFEAIFLAQIWKKMASQAREISGKKDEDRPFGAMEDLSIEMSSEVLAGQDGNGLWKVLYDSLAASLPKDEEKQG